MSLNMSFLKYFFKNISEDTIYDIEEHTAEALAGALMGAILVTIFVLCL